MEKTKWNQAEIQKWAGTFGRARFEKAMRKITHA
jgi:hypothetical protein